MLARLRVSAPGRRHRGRRARVRRSDRSSGRAARASRPGAPRRGRCRCSWRCCLASAGWSARSRSGAWLAIARGRRGTALVLAACARACAAAAPARGPRCGRVPALAPAPGADRRWRRRSSRSPGLRRPRLAPARPGGLGLLCGWSSPRCSRASTLLFGPADGTSARDAWEASVTDAAADALYPLVSTPALAPVIVWGLFAVALPFLVRGRSLALDLPVRRSGRPGWPRARPRCSGLMAATSSPADARGATAGAVVGAIVAIAAAGAGTRAAPAG